MLTSCLQCQPYFHSDDNYLIKRKIYILSNPSEYNSIPKSCILIDIKREGCKQIEYIFKDTANLINVKASKRNEDAIATTSAPKRKNFISVHGNVMYDFYYQSHLDTPYIGNDLYQHTISTFLDVRIKDDYPIRVYFTTRLNNSSYLRNITNLNFQYSPQTFQNSIRDRIKSLLQQQLDTSELSKLRNAVLAKTIELEQLRAWVNNPSAIQRLVEERESKYSKQQLSSEARLFANKYLKTNDSTKQNNSSELNNRWSWLDKYSRKVQQVKDSINSKDSSAQRFSEQYKEKKQRLDSLQIRIQELQKSYVYKKDSLLELKNSFTTKINTLRNPQQIKDVLIKSNIADSALPKGYRTLLAIRKFGVGTSTVDYSELSAKNITITGLQFEYSPKYYYAVAGGVINYRFRDYLLPEAAGPKQYLGLVRFGKETKDGNSLILTYYYGRKVLYNYYTTDSILQTTMPAPNYNLMGLTLENKIKIASNTYLIAEIAKSSLPYYHSTTAEKGITGTFDMRNRSNEAYSFKINTTITATQTKLEGYYKHYGANFQSFTLISTSAEQNAWLIKLDQDLFHKQFSVIASLRKNDYINPFLDQRYVSNTVFKSIQGTLHIKNWPVISAGFYPTTQLTKLNDVSFMENIFYSFTASANYLYNKAHTTMSTSIMYMKFYNRPADSVFIYYNTTNILINHIIFLRSASLQTSLSNAISTNYRLWSFGEGMQIRLRNWLSVGAGIKYNQQNLLNDPQIGYEVNSNIKINHLGSFLLRFEKTFIPGFNYQLLANNMGRITYYHNF